MFSVGGPRGLAWAGAKGKLDMDLTATDDMCQVEASDARSNAVAAGSVMLAVILWLDAYAGQAQERCRDSSDGRVVLPGHKQDRVVGRTHLGIWR